MHQQFAIIIGLMVSIAYGSPSKLQLNGSMPLCADGKGPLLEGGDVFNCDRGCPPGFDCEWTDNTLLIRNAAYGICCPNMDELYRLYGDDETDDVTKTITTITDDDQRRFDSIAAFVPFARAAPIQKITDGDSSSSTGQLQTSTTVEYSCDRQPYKTTCEITNTPTQFTLRWFLKDGQCCTFPWGVYPGDEIATQNAIRTKEDCEAICIRGESKTFTSSSGASKTGGSGETDNAGGGGGSTGGTSSGGSGRIPVGPIEEGSSGGGGGGRQKVIESGTGAGSGLPGVAATVKTCDRTPYKQMCDITNTPSQFTLRWYVKDGMCCTYPWGHCKGDEVATEPQIRTKEECEEYCLKGQRGSSSPPSVITIAPPSSGNNNLGQNAPAPPPNTESSSKSPAEQSNTPAPPPPQPQPPSPPTGGGKPTSNEKIENEYQF